MEEHDEFFSLKAREARFRKIPRRLYIDNAL